jgi:hypothetical protein
MNMEDTLWNYIDGTCTEAEKATVQQLIVNQSEWRQKHQELLDIHLLLNNHLDLEEPSMRFRQNIMESIAQYHVAPATKTYIDKKIIYGIGAFFLTMIAGLLIYVMAQINWKSPEPASNTLPYDLDKIEWSKLFNSSTTMVFLAVNVVLGLMLLDRYFSKKRRILQQKN